MPTGISRLSPEGLGQAWGFAPRCTQGKDIRDAAALTEKEERRAPGDTAFSPAGSAPGRGGPGRPSLCSIGRAHSVSEGSGARGTRTQGSSPTYTPKDPVEGPGRCRFSTAPWDLPRQPSLRGLGRRPSAVYQFALNTNYSCFQVSEFNLLKKKKKGK